MTGNDDATGSLTALLSHSDEALALQADFPAYRITTERHGPRGMRYVVERTSRAVAGPLLFVTDSADEVRSVLGAARPGNRP